MILKIPSASTLRDLFALSTPTYLEYISGSEDAIELISGTKS